MLRPASNDVIPNRIVPAKGVFYAWVILSIFLLDWAKSGLAGFEAAALMKPSLAPANAMRLLWHADRGWGGLSGWYKAAKVTYRYMRQKLARSPDAVWDGPGLLWCYLTFSSLLFYIAIPLSGISMDIDPAFKLSNRLVTILGTNASTFVLASNDAIQETAVDRWRVGNPTSPEAPSIFYAPEGTQNVSLTYYDDSVQAIYHADLENRSTNRTVTFFSGPRVAERAYGHAWGLQTSVSCAAVHPSELQLISNVTSVDNWTTTWGVSSAMYNPSTIYTNLAMLGLEPAMYFNDDTYGIRYRYIIASDRDVIGIGNSDYGDAAKLPIVGSLEMLMWQVERPRYEKDEVLTNMTTNPIVMASKSSDNLTYLGYGVQCNASSDIGWANLDARQATFSNFIRESAEMNVIDMTSANSLMSLPELPGPFAIQSLVFGALSKLTLGYMGEPTCMPGTDHICSVFYGANVATGGLPNLAPASTSTTGGHILQMPAIDPARMTYAIYKLFGQTAAAMMQVGPGDWTAELKGLDATNDITPGKVPWQLVLALLGLWTIITVVPQTWVFLERRWSSTLEAFELFRFGAEYSEAVQQFQSNDFSENTVLRSMPGMVGDLEPGGRTGFIGLSRYSAKPTRNFVNVRSVASSDH